MRAGACVCVCASGLTGAALLAVEMNECERRRCPVGEGPLGHLTDMVAAALGLVI